MLLNSITYKLFSSFLIFLLDVGRMDLESLRSSSSTANITMNDVRDWCKEYEEKYIKKVSTATDEQEANEFDDKKPKSKKRKPYKPRQSKGIKKLLLTEAIVDNDDGVCLL